MATNQNISKFYNNILAREFSRDFLARVLSINFAGGATFNEDELVYVRGATIPNRSISNVGVNYMGLTFNLPGNATYPGSGGYSLDFYCDARSVLRNKFIAESRRVFNDATSTGDYNVAGRDSVIVLAQLDKNLELINKYTLVGVSIRDVGALNYSIADGSGQAVNFSVQMAYHYFTEETAA